MLDPALTLPIRPRPFPGESTPGYLQRIAGANGFRSVPQLFTSLKRRHQSAFDELCTRLLLSDEERLYLFGALPNCWGQQDIPLGLAVSDFNQTCRRWCPICIKEGAVLHGWWGLKLVCTCASHGVWLKDACPRCTASGGWAYPAQTHCECGASFADDSTQEASTAVLAMTRLLCGDSSVLESLPCSAALTATAAHRMVRYLGPFHLDNKPEHPGQTENVHRLDVAQKLVVGAASLLAQWPTCLRERIGKIQLSATTSPSVRRTFAPLYRVLYDELSAPCYQFLRDAFESHLHEHWWGLVCQRNKRMRSETVKKHPRVTVPQMAAAAGVHASVVRHMVQADLIPSISVPLPSGRHSRSMHSDELHRIKVAVDGAYSLKQAAQALALPQTRLREFIAGGLVTPLVSRTVNLGAAAWVIPRSEIDRLHVQPAEAQSCSEVVLMRDVLKFWRLREAESVAVVGAVIDGQLSIIDCGQHKMPIGLAPLNALETKRWLVRRRLESGEGLSVDQAAKELGLKQEVGYELVRLGLLATVDAGLLGRRVMAPDLAAFRGIYVSLAELASEMNCSPRALLARLSVLPVSGPNIDGARQYFYRRMDLAGTGVLV